MQINIRRLRDPLRWFRARCQSFWPKPDKFLRALGALAGFDAVTAALGLIQHRSELLERTALLCGIPEEQLLRRLAESLGLPFVLKVPALGPDLKILESRLESFRNLGVLPLFTNGIVTGMAVTDPFAASSFLQCEELGIVAGRAAQIPFFLAPSGEIRRAIAESRDTFGSYKFVPSEGPRDPKLVETARQVVSLILSEAQTFGSDAVAVIFHPDCTEYSFNTRELKQARGNISQRVRPELRQLLADGASSQVMLVLPDRVAVRVRGDENRFELLRIATERKAPETPGGHYSGAASPVTIDAPRVLVVEDDPVFAAVLERFMERGGLISRRAESGIHALSLIKSGEFVPALIVCDLQMPNLDGFELIDALRALEPARSIPIAVLTSENDLETELKLIAKGVDVYLTKDDDPRVLMAHVKRLVARTPLRRAA
ncbi:MAG: response regulator [Oligoflexia bacterium]|nr:response regulator [Oligoflexia bacterium]